DLLQVFLLGCWGRGPKRPDEHLDLVVAGRNPLPGGSRNLERPGTLIDHRLELLTRLGPVRPGGHQPNSRVLRRERTFDVRGRVVRAPALDHLPTNPNSLIPAATPETGEKKGGATDNDESTTNVHGESPGDVWRVGRGAQRMAFALRASEESV